MNKKKKLEFDKLVFIITLTTSIVLAVIGFFCPPQGVIDGSVLLACSIFLGFASLAEVRALVDDGKSAKFTHGDTSIEISDDNDEN